MAKVVAENGESPGECPTVGLKLGRGHVHLGLKGAFECSKW